VCRIDIDRESELYYEGAMGLETARVVRGVGAREGDCRVASWGSGAEARVFAVAQIGGWG
jgi:hypothetical protein